jgi:hypothetical protein
MHEIAISKFNVTCMAVLESIRRTRQSVHVTKFGDPIAEGISALTLTRIIYSDK